ncbi:hypothetical protein UA08_04936 [Talaromyces atroroseus]|uniref:FAD-binding domain-containing protein n=1 Tax=Talaromyces atroroseus TaxID=1441469 RepID=A0A225AF66_TALAT|nr:hypothetical protein UA08_04936 [Talaromyces atroroseus]OKL59951.1 hypothetical protein UA08_04936 [Talaromyces atroroseus]
MVSTHDSPSPKLRVAVAGGGIAGLSIAIALRRHAGVDIQIYERTKQFREIGASISLAPNGLRTLEKIGASNALDSAVCTRQKSDNPMIYRHWKTGEVIATDVHKTVTTKRHFTARYHRAHLHKALLENVPSEIVHLGKKIVHIEVEVEGGGVTLSFEDGTTAEADICIGADGLHSNVRKAFVPTHTLRATGWVALRSTLESSLLNGIDFPEDAAHWIGPDRTFFHSHLGKGLFTVVGSLHFDPAEPNEDMKWDHSYSMDAFKRLYEGWHPAVRSLIDATPTTRLYPNMAGSPLDTWVFANRVTLAGDAAHTHGGAFAAGGSLAIDDAYALSLALEHVWPAASAHLRKPTDEELAAVFRLYEATRKPHINKIMAAASQQVIGNKAKSAPDETQTEKFLRQRVDSRPDPSWISEHDVEKAFQTAVREMETARSWCVIL